MFAAKKSLKVVVNLQKLIPPLSAENVIETLKQAARKAGYSWTGFKAGLSTTAPQSSTSTSLSTTAPQSSTSTSLSTTAAQSSTSTSLSTTAPQSTTSKIASTISATVVPPFSPVLTNNSKIHLNSSNVTPVLNSTRQAIKKNGTKLNSGDIYHVSQILQHASNLTNLTNKDFYNFVASIDILLDLENQKFQKSQNHYQSSKRILESLSAMTLGLKENQSIYVAKAKNLAFTSQINYCGGKTTGYRGIAQFNSGSKFRMLRFRDPINQTDRSLSILLPHAIACSQPGQRVNFAIFTNQKLFTANNGSSDSKDSCEIRNDTAINGVVSALLIRNGSYFHGPFANSAELIFNFQHYQKPLHSSSFEAGFWTFQNWSTKGCNFASKEESVYTFHCRHLTDFTMLVTSRTMDPSLCNHDLMLIGYGATSISTLSLGIVIVLIVFSCIKADEARPSILIGSGESAETLLFLSTLFCFFLLFTILGDSSHMELSSHDCSMVAAVLYTLLISTILHSGFHALTCLKRVCDPFNRCTWLKIATLPWLIISSCTAVPVLLSIGLWYGTKTNFFNRDDYFCWIRPTYVIHGIVIPLGILVLADVLVTLFTVKTVFFPTKGNSSGMYLETQSSSTTRKIMFRKKVAMLIIMQFTLGLPWVFQFFTIGAPNLIPMHYVFTIFNGLQGFILSTLFCLSKHEEIKKRYFSGRKSIVPTLPTHSTDSTSVGQQENELLETGINANSNHSSYSDSESITAQNGSSASVDEEYSYGRIKKKKPRGLFSVENYNMLHHESWESELKRHKELQRQENELIKCLEANHRMQAELRVTEHKFYQNKRRKNRLLRHGSEYNVNESDAEAGKFDAASDLSSLQAGTSTLMINEEQLLSCQSTSGNSNSSLSLSSCANDFERMPDQHKPSHSTENCHKYSIQSENAVFFAGYPPATGAETTNQHLPKRSAVSNKKNVQTGLLCYPRTSQNQNFQIFFKVDPKFIHTNQRRNSLNLRHTGSVAKRDAPRKVLKMVPKNQMYLPRYTLGLPHGAHTWRRYYSAKLAQRSKNLRPNSIP